MVGEILFQGYPLLIVDPHVVAPGADTQKTLGMLEPAQQGPREGEDEGPAQERNGGLERTLVPVAVLATTENPLWNIEQFIGPREADDGEEGTRLEQVDLDGRFSYRHVGSGLNNRRVTHGRLGNYSRRE